MNLRHFHLVLSLGLVHAAAEDAFNPDPGVPPVRPRESIENQRVKRRVIESPALNPGFNPDSGVPPVISLPALRTDFGLPTKSEYTNFPSPPATVRRTEFLTEPVTAPIELLPPAPENLRVNAPAVHSFSVPGYPLTSAGQIPPNTEARTNRWKIELEPWQRYTSGQAETPYQTTRPAMWHPYRQSVLKGDVPIFGQDVFLNLSASLQSELEFRRAPLTDQDELLSQNYAGFSASLFQGETVFRPARWRFQLRPVFNVNHLESGPSSRTKGYFALQEAYGETTLTVLSENYDFLAARLGSQPFNGDFRGFIFNDVNSGFRLFGNAVNNRWQYNLAVFDMREKDISSELNSFDERGQQVIAANVYRQDTIWNGYTSQLSFHANLDGSEQDAVHACYLGWAGDGHIGRLNVSHAFYQVLGTDEFNAIGGRGMNINAQMAALELSLDHDWLRYKGSFFYASGDREPTDGTATGFDAILDSPHFAGAPFSAYARQSYGAGAAGVSLKGRNSLLPSLRTSKLEGQASFVNPGIFLFGLGAEARLTQKVRAFTQANYLRFAATETLEHLLSTADVNGDLGVDLSLGVQYRPFLVNNVIVNAGFGALIPGSAYRTIYPDSPFPYSGLLTLTLNY